MNTAPPIGATKSKSDDRKPVRESITKVIDTIVGRFGKGALMALGGESGEVQRYETIATGSINLDRALGIGGLPKGRIVEIYGPESSGKTTLTLHIVAEAQKRGILCAFLDAEHAFDVAYAKALGVITEDLLVAQPDHGEQALEIADTLCRTGTVGLIIVDSVAALIPKAELEGDMGDQHLGLQARLMSQAMRKIAGVAHQTNTTVVFINQLRHKIGVQFGSPETTTGGNALKYFASVRLDIRRIQTVRDGERAVASRTRVKVAKNKCAPPFTEAEFEIAFGRGIDREAEILDAALERGTVVKNGSWFAHGATRIGQGRAAALDWLREHAKERDELARDLLATVLPAKPAAAA
ncbi:MAG: recombinase RecA [Deltaproteobacteria bacterium]|nr:recombinase RecA [Deltaproteobacteria bacterium]MBK8239070.1 recombinase RecA [Deltaproteobacteria bacterium]MBK8717580.1 recombinase RecA [Deltaproteobacteria bacterium]MBP7285811.1 recombinase RecA [Nannocystaceae bacterium]